MDNSLRAVESIFQSELVDVDSEVGKELQFDTQSLRLQYQLLPDADPAAKRFSSEDRDRFRDKLKDFKEKESDERLLNQVVLALSHTLNESSTYQIADALPDIVQAEKQMNQIGRDDLPPWCRERWGKFRDDGENSFISLLNSLLKMQDSSLTLEQRKDVKDNWPDLFIESELNQLLVLVNKGSWDQFSSELDRFHGDHKIDELPVLHGPKVGVFDRLREGLADDADAPKVLKSLSESFREAPMRVYFRVALSRWFDERVQRQLQLATCSLDDAKKLLESGQELLGTEEIESLDRLLLVTAIRHGPDSFSDSLVEQRVEHYLAKPGSSAEQAYSHAIQLENRARSKQRMSSLEASKLNNWKLPDTVFEGYQQYIESLIAWHSVETGKANAIWVEQTLQPLGSDVREALGPLRCEWIAQELLDQMSDEMGIERSSPKPWASLIKNNDGANESHERLTQTLSLREVCEWWLEGTVNPPGIRAAQLHLRNEMQQFVSDFAKVSHDDEQVVRLKMSRELGSLVGRGEAERFTEQNLFDWAAYRWILVKCSLPTKRPATWTTRLLEVALTCWKRSLEDGPEERIDSDLLSYFLDPTCAIAIGELSQPSDELPQDPSETARPRQQQIDFLHKYLGIEGTNLSIDAAEIQQRLEQGHRAAALLAEHLPQDQENEPKRLQAFLQAAEFLEMQHESQRTGKNLWSEESLQAYEAYAKAASEIDPKNAQVALLQAFSIYYRAITDARTSETRSVDWEPAVQELRKAISIFITFENPSVKQQAALYKARVRFADACVLLAFGPQITTEQKKSLLNEAQAYAQQAVDMIEIEGGPKLPGVFENHGYMSLGNASEDLAYYCDEKIEENYERALEAFKEAIKKTSGHVSPTASICLARCRYRQAIGTAQWGPHQFRQQLEQAENDLGKLDERASESDQADWYTWRAQIRFMRGGADALDEVLEDAGKAREIYNRNADDFGNIQRQAANELLWFYADCLYAKQQKFGQTATGPNANSQFAQEALEVISKEIVQPDPNTFWKVTVLSCKLYLHLRKPNELLRLVNNIPDERLLDLRGDTEAVSRDLAEISLVVCKAAFIEAGIKIDQRVNRDDGYQCLRTLQSRISRILPIEFPMNDRAIVYSNMVRVISQSFSYDPLIDRVIAYIDLIKQVENAKLDGSSLTQILQKALYNLISIELESSKERESKVAGDIVRSFAVMPEQVYADFEKHLISVATMGFDQDLIRNLLASVSRSRAETYEK